MFWWSVVISLYVLYGSLNTMRFMIHFYKHWRYFKTKCVGGADITSVRRLRGMRHEYRRTSKSAKRASMAISLLFRRAEAHYWRHDNAASISKQNLIIEDAYHGRDDIWPSENFASFSPPKSSSPYHEAISQPVSTHSSYAACFRCASIISRKLAETSCWGEGFIFTAYLGIFSESSWGFTNWYKHLFARM